MRDRAAHLPGDHGERPAPVHGAPLVQARVGDATLHPAGWHGWRDVQLRSGSFRTFWQVGEALAEVRDGKLYKETHGTFEDYCRERWGMSDSRARQLIGAAETVQNLETVTIVTVPTSEGVTRVLRPLPPDQQRAAWTDAVESSASGQPTAREVKVAVEKITAPKPVYLRYAKKRTV